MLQLQSAPASLQKNTEWHSRSRYIDTKYEQSGSETRLTILKAVKYTRQKGNMGFTF